LVGSGGGATITTVCPPLRYLKWVGFSRSIRHPDGNNIHKLPFEFIKTSRVAKDFSWIEWKVEFGFNFCFFHPICTYSTVKEGVLLTRKSFLGWLVQGFLGAIAKKTAPLPCIIQSRKSTNFRARKQIRNNPK